MTEEASAPEPRPAPGLPPGPVAGPAPATAPRPDLVVVRVRLPAHLRTLVQLEKETERGPGHGTASGPGHGTGSEVTLELDSPGTQSSLLDALETRYPVLIGTIRDPRTRVRRPFIRFFACEEDLSHEPPDSDLPAPVLAGTEPFVILGAMAGG